MLNALPTMGTEPNWILVTILGTLLGAVVTPVVAFSRYLVRRFQHHALCAEWYSYHLTFRDNNQELVSSIYRISRGIRSALAVRAETLPGESRRTGRMLLYRGTVEHDGGHYVMNLAGASHNERIIIRFARRLPPTDHMLVGIWLAADHDNKVAAGVQLFSRTQLDIGDAHKILDSWIYGSEGAMRLRGGPPG